MITAFLLWRLLGSAALPAPPPSAWFSIPILIVVLLLPALFEEIGWRGYAFPRMQTRSNALTASLLLGIIQAIWHLPIWFIPGMGFEGLPFPYYALLVTGLSVLAGWLYNSTGGSLLIVGLLHAAINAFPAPWGAALQMLPQSEWGMNIQIPVAITVAVFSLLVVLLTDSRTLTRKASKLATTSEAS
jgi:membrane protease YdiL (CAAX protease family)